jgi:hypothetical protein
MKLLEFLKMVRVEATHLRDNATKEEKSKLDFDELMVLNVSNCIYGQMTGNCNSYRAKELYTKKFDSMVSFYAKDIGAVAKIANPMTEKEKAVRSYRGFGQYTPIELYVTSLAANNEGLIKYIKGINKTLKL